MRKQLALTLLLAGLLVVACSAPAPAAPTGAPAGPITAGWPTEAWPVADPEARGVDPAQLDGMFDAIERRGIDVHAVLVVRDGAIVAERYTPPYTADTPHEVYSVTKSVVSALVGMAIARGEIASVDEPVLALLPAREFAEVDARKRAMRLEDLLTMTSGLAWSDDEGIGRLLRGRDWVAEVMDLPMAAPPGERFSYCTGCSHLLAVIVRQASGRDLLDDARARLFEPLGIRNFVWQTAPDGVPNGGWGLELTPRDMAKLGYLYLHDGQWDGRQLVPAEWVRASVTRHVATDGEYGYGYQWWVSPRDGAYFARGRSGQLIVVIPDRALVVVFTADVADDRVLLELVDEYILPAAGVAGR